MDGIQLNILQNTYDVKYPTIGQFIDLRVKENIISQGQLVDLMIAGVKLFEAADAALAVKVVAFFQVCVPELMKDLKVKNIRDLSVKDFLHLRKAYVKEVLPWLNEWQDKMKALLEEELDD